MYIGDLISVLSRIRTQEGNCNTNIDNVVIRYDTGKPVKVILEKGIPPNRGINKTGAVGGEA